MSKVLLSSQALVLLGAQPIASFTEGSTGAEIASILFDTTYESLLTETRWRFATKQQRLNKDIVPATEGLNSFQLPPDVLYVIEANCDYEINQKKLLTNHTDVTINYVFSPEIDQLPAYFVQALVLALAARFAVPISADLNKAQMYTQLTEQQLKKARYADSSSRTNSIIEDSPYTEARFSN